MSVKGYQISAEVNHYKNGEMNTDTLQFQLFVMCANKVISYKPFYILPIGQINEYFQVVKFFTINEVEIIITNIISISKTKYEANNLLKRILPSVRCKNKQSKNKYYLSPCCCKELYDQFTNKTYKLNNGKYYHLSNLFDFESENIIKIRQSQERFSDPPKFIHDDDVYQLIISNNLSSIYHRKTDRQQKKDKNDKKPPKPDPWIPQIHLAVKNNDLKSIQYNIYLIPLLRNAPDENGKTPVHIAAEFGTPETINLLKKLNADFAIFDYDGNLPCHYLKTIPAISAFANADCKITALNKRGQTILDYKSDPFEKDTIDQLIRVGFDIIAMDEKSFLGTKILHNHIYAKTIDFDLHKERMQNEGMTKDDLEYNLFQMFIRANLAIKSAIYHESLNKDIYMIIMQALEGLDVKKDEAILRKAVVEDNVDLIEFCMKIGMPPDICDEEGITNLMILCDRNDEVKATIFAANYCDPNKVNKNGENCFWIAASKEYFEISTMLYEEHQADPNIISNSGQTLMHIAYESKNIDLLYYLLDLGASPNIPNCKKETVQFRAFLNRDFDIAELIQDNFKGNINYKDGNGNTLGHLAIHVNDEKFLKYLINRKLFVESKDANERTLFMLAIMKLNDIHILQFLLDNGADINTQDNLGNTPFYYVCADKKFNKDKFTLLLNNKCNINFRNNKHDFPVSQLLQKELYQDAITLLEMNANINDSESPTEPIVISLQKNNRSIFEKLVNLGANASNSHFPVVEKYIKSDFFDFEILKKMPCYNLLIGCPFQTALENDERDAAIFLWKLMNDEQKKAASKSVNSMKQTILVLSILNNDEYFLQELIKPGFDLTTPDINGRTPFIHLCSKNMTKWMDVIMPLLSIKEMGVSDKSQYSAMSFICKNGHNQLAEKLFMKGINVFSIRCEKNSILLKYADALKQHEKLCNILWEKKIKIDEKLDSIQSKIDSCHRRIEYNENRIHYYDCQSNSSEFSLEKRNEYIQEFNKFVNLNSNLSNDLQIYENQYNIEKTEKQYIMKNYNALKNASRFDILYHIESLKKYTNI